MAMHGDSSVSPDRWSRGAPFVARTATIRRPLGPVAYDYVKVIVVRDGSAFLFSEFGQQIVKPGDVILLGANVLAGSEPEGHITVTTIYLDTDYMLDQVRWQYAAYLEDRLDAQEFAEAIYTEPAQILRLGEGRAGLLMPWLDELVALSVEGDFVRHYLRIQALWFQIAYVIAPFIKVSPVRISPSQRAHVRPTLPRNRRFAPLRADVRRAVTLLRDNPARRWTLENLAAEVHLSPSPRSTPARTTKASGSRTKRSPTASRSAKTKGRRSDSLSPSPPSHQNRHQRMSGVLVRLQLWT